MNGEKESAKATAGPIQTADGAHRSFTSGSQTLCLYLYESRQTNPAPARTLLPAIYVLIWLVELLIKSDSRPIILA